MLREADPCKADIRSICLQGKSLICQDNETDSHDSYVRKTDPYSLCSTKREPHLLLMIDEMNPCATSLTPFDLFCPVTPFSWTDIFPSFVGWRKSLHVPHYCSSSRRSLHCSSPHVSEPVAPRPFPSSIPKTPRARPELEFYSSSYEWLLDLSLCLAGQALWPVYLQGPQWTSSTALSLSL